MGCLGLPASDMVGGGATGLGGFDLGRAERESSDEVEETDEEALRRLEFREGTFMLGAGGGMLGFGRRGALPEGGSGRELALSPRREGEGLRLPLGEGVRRLCSSS